jgi:bifunctional non-homologous end joining protein LigD
MQLYAALSGDLTSDQVRDLTQQLAQELTKAHPDLIVWKMTKSMRPGKVFLDWSQNVAAKTTICPYSLRGKETPTVAAPRTWDEVEAGAAAPDVLQQLMFDEVLERLDDQGDLIADLLG